eukprot:COSAG01_NODE_70841_length_257_cov_1.291139_1_plen_42_part_10
MGNVDTEGVLFCAGPPAVRAAERPPGPAVAVGGIHGVWGDRG